jgi:F-type H+-transporting ATPase subunit b
MQLPQLDFEYYPSQFFWLVISYSFLYLVLKFVILPNFAKIYKKRETLLNTALTSTKENITSAKARLEAKRAELIKIKQEAENKIAQASINAEKSFNEKKLIIDQKNATVLANANHELQELKAKLEQNANIEIAKSTSLILKSIFNIEINTPDILNSLKGKKYDS